VQQGNRVPAQPGQKIGVAARSNCMESLVTVALGLLARSVDAITGVAIGVGIFAAFTRTMKLALRLGVDLDTTMSEVRLALGRWLALALELALAADILRTVMIPTWDEIGKLSAIVVVRTVLNYFLQREIQQEQKKAEAEYSFHAAA
jgi:uncharacterized membrane protein